MKALPAAVFAISCTAVLAAADAQVFDAETVRFARQVDIDRLSLLPVQTQGRESIWDTHARRSVSRIYGSTEVQGLPPSFVAMEWYVNTGAYLDRPIVYIREKQMRAAVAEALVPPTRETFQETDRLPPTVLLDERAFRLLITNGRASVEDFQRAAEIPQIGNELARLAAAKEYRLPLERLEIRVSALLDLGQVHLPAGAGRAVTLDSLLEAGKTTTQPQAAPADAAAALSDAWRARDADAVNRALATLEAHYSSAAPVRPLRTMERFYNRANHGLWALLPFLIAVLLLVIAAATGRRAARIGGLIAFSLGVLVLLLQFGIRWAISGREWYLPPLLNQYEAVMGSALLGTMLALGLELRRGRSFWALAAAIYASAVLVASMIFPEHMSSAIQPGHGILNSPIMASHVAVIILGHALVGMTFVLSSFYLILAAVRGLGRSPSAPAALTVDGRADSVLAGLDRSNLLAAQLALLLVTAGTVLGAYWGEIAWGRWWGWDPKETWSLITIAVYVVVIHLRYISGDRWRGVVTSCGCILGCLVMLFNWTAVNFLIPGKHSYA
ncbi:MAG: cytochrome c biogenesis protein [Phycisphaerae bacterium]